ncbi:hypothetical protein VK70_07230 [Paenibacillus durus ATCC 35681]|uniref:Uncharacterized protein n=2 Tax=Paenibacillus durus TaxID=44251 RepID=A0A0F7FF40_PAEDU|nr:hypothetical protein VK70_07230 [Paenibacillus durus ATCC 35681]
MAYPWVAGQKVADGIWKAVVPFNKHFNETGLYYNDVWVDGTYFGGSQTVVRRNTVRIPEKVSLKDGSYDIIVEGIPENINKLTFYTWTEANGQDDLRQSGGQKLDSNTWKITIPFNEHNNETGVYITHIYTIDSYGNSTGIGVSTMAASFVQAPTEANLLDNSYEVYAYGISKEAINVTFPTWTEHNGNDDLAYPWVAGQKVADGIWKAVVPFNKHFNETGLYYNDVWVDGTYFGGSQTVVRRNTVRIPEKVSLKDGSYDIIVEGIPENINKLTFYTWTEANGQDDLRQSGGQKLDSNTWKITIPFNEHNNEAGVYTTHIYTIDSFGNSTGIGVQTTAY